MTLTIEATHRSLEQRLREARRPHRDPHRPRDNYAATDTFMAATSRHLAAVEASLLGRVRHQVPDGEQLCHHYLQAARRLEHTLSLLKGRLYGEAHAIHLAWPELWETVGSELGEHNRIEGELVEALVRCRPDETDALARQVFESEVSGPTRPHPYTPHTGLFGLAARRMWAWADRLWDAAEGRVIPDPVAPPHHRHDSLLAQYLVADPKFDADATIVEHRHRVHPKAGGVT
ncbi:MAG TPA: hypothetical protein VFV89_10585 [Nocardioides sp.]|nr:hypothetical protein [Nocardioides sp.]